MLNLNRVTLLGRLGSDPEVKSLNGGQSVAKFSVATSEKWSDKDGKSQERTEWHKVVVWGKLAEACGKHLSKGSQVFLEGKLQTRSWGEGDAKKYATEIIAGSVIFLDGNKIGDSGSTNEYPF